MHNASAHAPHPYFTGILHFYLIVEEWTSLDIILQFKSFKMAETQVENCQKQPSGCHYFMSD